MAQKEGMSTLEYNLYAEKNREIDKKIDAITAGLNQSQENLIVDSRLAWHFIKKSYKVYLYLRPEIAAERILKDEKREKEKYPDYDTALKAIKSRRESELKRFQSLYGVELDDQANYDLVINTEAKSPKAIADQITQGLEKNFLNNNP